MEDWIFLTTAINYTNGPPHIGHAYEAISTDIMVRWHRLMKRNVYFLTGSDEHGQKIAKTAEAQGLTPIELCDKNVLLFKRLNQNLQVSYDLFVRTTENYHKKTAQIMFERVKEKGDIYLGNYEGWYNPREERFVPEQEARENNYQDPVSGTPYLRVSEPSYFFKMEPYRLKLIEHINSHPAFIRDSSSRNIILKRLEEPLTDLSISRTSFDWGIPIPNSEGHVMYVWFDALTNYLSGSNYFGNGNYLWPSTHIIGQDILWFHAVIWPCMLMSAGIELPQAIIVHGFINDAQGKKMSKSLGNVVDPNDLLAKYDSDVIRYYLIRGGIYGKDFRFSEENLIDKNNSELADLYGNFVRRVFTLAKKTFNYIIPETEYGDTFDLSCIEEIDKYIYSGQLSSALEIIVNQLHEMNRWIYEQAPWNVKDRKRKESIIVQALEKLLICTHLLYPFIPNSCKIVLDQFKCMPLHLTDLKQHNLKPGDILAINEKILFQKI